MIQRSVVIRAGLEHTFRAWSDAIDLWWPPTHRVRPRPESRMIMEGFPEGLLVERAPSGETLRLFGRITAWEPPSRLAYDFYLGGTVGQPTEIEIRFTATATGTRIDVQHHRGHRSDETWGRTNHGFAHAWGEVTEAFTHHIGESIS